MRSPLSPTMFRRLSSLPCFLCRHGHPFVIVPSSFRALSLFIAASCTEDGRQPSNIFLLEDNSSRLMFLNGLNAGEEHAGILTRPFNPLAHPGSCTPGERVRKRVDQRGLSPMGDGFLLVRYLVSLSLSLCVSSFLSLLFFASSSNRS